LIAVPAGRWGDQDGADAGLVFGGKAAQAFNEDSRLSPVHSSREHFRVYRRQYAHDLFGEVDLSYRVLDVPAKAGGDFLGGRARVASPGLLHICQGQRLVVAYQTVAALQLGSSVVAVQLCSLQPIEGSGELRAWQHVCQA
jgi:hypothetical protein